MSAAQRPAPGRLIVVEGIDGSGKSTVCRLLADQLAGVVHLTNKTRCEEPPWGRRMMTELAGLIWPTVDTDFDHLLPASFWLHLQAAWYALLSRLVLVPRLAAGETLLVDGWYYKLVAKLALRGFSPPRLAEDFAEVVQPDQVVLLLPDPAAVWERRTEFRLTELGLHHPDEYPELGRDSFIHYQNRIAAELCDLAARHGWTQVAVASDATAAQTAAAVLDVLDIGEVA